MMLLKAFHLAKYSSSVFSELCNFQDNYFDQQQLFLLYEEDEGKKKIARPKVSSEERERERAMFVQNSFLPLDWPKQALFMLYDYLK